MKRLKKSDIEVGAAYTMMVGRNVVKARIVEERADGGWNAVYVETGQPVVVKTAERMRMRVAETIEAPATAPKQIVSKEEYEAAAGTLAKAKRTRAPKAKVEGEAPKDKAPSGLDLAAAVLAEAGEPLNAKTICERVIAKGWQTAGKTPEATLYAAMFTEIKKKGAEARFVKVGRGQFQAAGKAA